MSFRISPVALSAMVALAIGGGAAGARAQAPGPPQGSPSPPDYTAGAPRLPEDYRVQPFDTFDVSVLQLESINRTVQVSSIGVISLPLAGDFHVAGKTTKQIADEIAARLGEHDLQNPQVTVSLKEAASRKFTVEGSVVQPGVYTIAGPLTLLQGVATAKGEDQFADDRRVTVFRETNGQRQAILYNLADVRHGKVADPPIYAQDVIVVASSKSKRFIRDVGPLIPLVYLLPKP